MVFYMTQTNELHVTNKNLKDFVYYGKSGFFAPHEAIPRNGNEYGSVEIGNYGNIVT